MERKNRLKRSYMVMQDVNYELFAESVEAECSFGIRNPDLSLAASTLEELGLAPYRERHPNTLSGGQKQRVAIGAAIIRQPKAFLMDEPLSNLDAKLRAQMRVELQKLHKELDTTIIYVTHDQTEAMTLGTKIVVMRDGLIQQVDTPQSIYDNPITNS